jgi:hypothetical protein
MRKQQQPAASSRARRGLPGSPECSARPRPSGAVSWRLRPYRGPRPTTCVRLGRTRRRSREGMSARTRAFSGYDLDHPQRRRCRDHVAVPLRLGRRYGAPARRRLRRGVLAAVPRTRVVNPRRATSDAPIARLQAFRRPRGFRETQVAQAERHCCFCLVATAPGSRLLPRAEAHPAVSTVRTPADTGCRGRRWLPVGVAGDRRAPPHRRRA